MGKDYKNGWGKEKWKRKGHKGDAGVGGKDKSYKNKGNKKEWETPPVEGEWYEWEVGE